jgi:hypothetical protein
VHSYVDDPSVEWGVSVVDANPGGGRPPEGTEQVRDAIIRADTLERDGSGWFAVGDDDEVERWHGWGRNHPVDVWPRHAPSAHRSRSPRDLEHTLTSIGQPVSRAVSAAVSRVSMLRP